MATIDGKEFMRLFREGLEGRAKELAEPIARNDPLLARLKEKFPPIAEIRYGNMTVSNRTLQGTLVPGSVTPPVSAVPLAPQRRPLPEVPEGQWWEVWTREISGLEQMQNNLNLAMMRGVKESTWNTFFEVWARGQAKDKGLKVLAVQNVEWQYAMNQDAILVRGQVLLTEVPRPVEVKQVPSPRFAGLDFEEEKK
jgi:hypothetical protein